MMKSHTRRLSVWIEALKSPERDQRVHQGLGKEAGQQGSINTVRNGKKEQQHEVNQAVDDGGEEHYEQHEVEIVGIEAVRNLSQEEMDRQEGKGAEAEIHAAETVGDKPEEKGEQRPEPPPFPEPQVGNDHDEEIGLERIGNIGRENSDLHQERRVDDDG